MKPTSILTLLVFLLAAAGNTNFALANDLASEPAVVDAIVDAVVAPEPVSKDIFTAEQRAEIAQTEQKYEFQAEVNRMMDILINSLYTNRDVFIREIISNAADALDKIRFIGLTDKAALGDGEAAELDIKIAFDKEKRTLTITDKGVGMTKDELIKNLGVVARSGTSEFVEAASSGKKDALSLIGQFGVGFYSVYLVADKVTVTSKSINDEQYIWESTANSVFTIAKDPRGNTLNRGTQIVLHLKDDADEFLSEHKLIDLTSKYSQFINFPIYVQVTKTITEEVDEPVEETDDNSDLQVEEEDEDAKEKPKKTVTRVVNEDKRVNAVKAIWTRSPAEIKDEEYNEFYKSLTKDTTDPLTKLHFTAEGDITFKSILYMPSTAEHGLYDRFYDSANTVKLYVRRVLISDQFKDFLPRYMNFVKGVVDSDDLPLNVNRETLAQSRVLKVMSKKISRKVLELLKKMAAEEKRAIEKEENETEKDEDAEDKDEEAEADEDEEEAGEFAGKKLYTAFWNEYGKSIKLGVLEDATNKNQLVKLLRFKSLKSDGKLISLEDYVEDMSESQKSIYFITGESEEAIMASPFLESARKKNVDVLILADPLDEYVVGALPEFDGTPLQSLTKEGVSFGDEKKNLLKKQADDFKPLTEFMARVLGNKVEKVLISQRLADTPMVVVTAAYGWSANMERIMKSQAFADPKQAKYMSSKRTLEINPYHPIIKALNEDANNEKKSNDLIELMFEAAMLQSGFQVSEPRDFSSRVARVVSSALNVDPNATIDTEPTDDIIEEAEVVDTPAAAGVDEDDEAEVEADVEAEADVDGKDEL